MSKRGHIIRGSMNKIQSHVCMFTDIMPTVHDYDGFTLIYLYNV